MNLPAVLAPSQPPSKKSVEQQALGVIVGHHRLKRQVFFKDLSRGCSAWDLGADEELVLPAAIEAAGRYPQQVTIGFRELFKNGVVVARELISLTEQPSLFEIA